MMNVDVILLSTPNKNIDYPGLSLPSLTASLRQKGYMVEQYDLNIILRDQLLTNEGLTSLLENTLPLTANALSYSEFHLTRLYSVYEFLRNLRSKHGFGFIEEVKLRAQAREYQWIFKQENRFLSFIALFKINRALHYLIDFSLNTTDTFPNNFIVIALQKIFENVQSIIAFKKPKLVGLSILDIQRGFSMELIRRLRPNYSGIIAVGGADPTRFPREYIKHCKQIDIVFYREAEISLPQLMLELENLTPSFKSVPGIFYRDKKGNIIENKAKPVDISCIPTPDFRGLPLNLYLTPSLPIQASRGCYWQKCRFCIHWDTYCDFHTRNPSKVVEDIKTLISQYDARYFHFTDDCIPVPIARELVQQICQNSLDVRWLAYFRLENELNIELLRGIFDAGGRVLEMGLESASERILKLMNKNISIQVAERIVNDASSVGLLVKLFMFHGFPGERIEDISKTIEFTQRHIQNKRIRAFMPLRNRFEILRGSDIYESARIGLEDEVARLWQPSGLFGIRGEHELIIDEMPIRDVISTFVGKMREYMNQNMIYNTDDENVMVDLIVLDHMPLSIKWRCI